MRVIDVAGLLSDMKKEFLQEFIPHLPEEFTFKGKGRFKGKTARLVKSEAPERCPRCRGPLSFYQNIGCDGSFCFGIRACPRHPLEVYPSVSGPH